MDHNKSTLERAFEIARSGGCVTVGDIRDRLKAEGYDQHQLIGRAIYKQLTELAKKARTNL